MPHMLRHLYTYSVSVAYQVSSGCCKNSLTHKECKHWAEGFHVDLVLDFYSQHLQVTTVLPSADPSKAGILPCYSTTDNKHKFSVWRKIIAYKILEGKLQGSDSKNLIKPT